MLLENGGDGALDSWFAMIIAEHFNAEPLDIVGYAAFASYRLP